MTGFGAWLLKLAALPLLAAVVGALPFVGGAPLAASTVAEQVQAQFLQGTLVADAKAMALSDWLTPAGWNMEACAVAGGMALFEGQIYNATPGTEGQDVNLWMTGFGGLPTAVTPTLIPRTPYGQRFPSSVVVSVPQGTSTGTYTGTLYAEGIGTNRLELPLALMVGLPCPFGRLILDGADDYAEADDHAELDLGDEPGESLTVEAQVNFQIFGAAQIVRKANAYSLYTEVGSSGGYSLRCLNFKLWEAGNIYYWIQQCTTQYGGGFYNSGWHHVAGVFDRAASQVSLYMDGERVAGPYDRAQANNNSTDPLRIGENMNGAIDEVRLSDAVRYSGPSYGLPTTPFTCDEHTRALWHFDEVHGTTRFHDVCGADNLLVGYNDAHSGGSPAPPGSLAGAVDLQGRSNDGGALVSLGGGAYTTTTSSTGAFTVGGIAPGVYTTTASMAGYLFAQRTGVVVTSSETTTLPTVTLLGGDATADGDIDIFDLTLLGAGFGASSGAADITGDGAVNVFDLVLVGANFGRSAPSPWP